MIEGAVNIAQLIMAACCAAFALAQARHTGSRAWTFLGLFFCAFALGDLYWQLFITFFGRTPRYSFIPYASWDSACLFLLLLLAETQGPIPWARNLRQLWPLPALAAAMCAFYLQYGAWFSNVVSAALMTLLLVRSVRGILSLRGKTGQEAQARWLYGAALLFCVLEYGAWTSSCFFSGDTLANPYLWFDALMTASFVLDCAAVRKAVGA